jgi:predicted phosphodiesterase
MMRRLLWALWGIGVLFVVAIITCIIWARWSGRSNFARRDPRELRSTLEKTRIAVFGDTQKGLAGFAKLAERAKAERIDLAIHTGDLVSRADVGHYDLALTWVERARLGVPFVVTPGNHDIKGGKRLFEKRIGPRQFAFQWGPVKIVIVDNATGPPDVASVERMLAEARRPILLFMHVPPLDGAAEKPAYREFLAAVRKYPVLYVFSGHVHGYSRVERDGIVFISNGVGGDSESWQFNQKAHMTIVEASGDSLRAREVSIDPVFSIWANVEHLAIGHVGEILLRRVWGLPALLCLIVALAIGYRRLRRTKIRFTPAKLTSPPELTI